MNREIWVDDEKEAPEGCDVARTYYEAARMLAAKNYDVLYLDHDLGHPRLTGYDLLMDLIVRDRVPPRVECISFSPIGRKRIEEALASYRSSPTSAVEIQPTEG